ncbi:hypothetical protein OG601_42115 [Streptomyces sp. NBC_01239]|uniref:hypothetical protein n=1 Tax=Streptomyces sp. NBC_01239 TaxID=2903792 RepID=UPI0022532A3F|nr:hypothetical protein [Streptomyces sp. NBC_01239]MCX4817196.1 hypothetical protein [Streptomyces sp. NBC_01239]
MTAMDEHPVDTGAFLNDIEGHLLIAAAHAEGRTAAARFTARFDWLTEGQRAEVEREFEAEYLALTRLSWQRTAERGRQLRDEYEETYRRLRQRAFAYCLLACALLAATGLVAFALT